jgi:hypothetical protein
VKLFIIDSARAYESLHVLGEEILGLSSLLFCGKVIVALTQTRILHVSEGKSMSKSSHKFQERMQSGMTFEQYFRDKCHEMICLAEEFERVLGRKRTLEIIGKARERYIFEITKKERRLAKSFDDFKAAEKAENASTYFQHILTLTYPEEKSNRLKLHVTECLWAKVFREMKAADLGYVLNCQPDFTYPQVCNPHIKLKRTKTLMQGDNCCDHTFYWEE